MEVYCATAVVKVSAFVGRRPIKNVVSVTHSVKEVRRYCLSVTVKTDEDTSKTGVQMAWKKCHLLKIQKSIVFVVFYLESQRLHHFLFGTIFEVAFLFDFHIFANIVYLKIGKLSNVESKSIWWKPIQHVLLYFMQYHSIM